ncbi:MAG: tetratricopeptide repeat protein [Acidimicrobiales bacterium]
MNETEATSSELWSLRDQRDFLLASLADSEREHAAGDLSESDYEVLRGRDEQLLSAVVAQLERLSAKSESDAASSDASGVHASEHRSPSRPRRRRSILVVGIVVFVFAGSILLVNQLSSRRLPGQVLSGSVDVNSSQQIERQLAQAATLVENGKMATALSLYHRVLLTDPNQPVALTELGWIEYQAGVDGKDPSVISAGRSLVEKATKVSPGFAEPHLFLGLIEYQQDHDTSSAIKQISLFLADKPTPVEIAAATPEIKKVYASAGKALPASVVASK